MRKLSGVLVSLALLQIAGCYRYVPAERAAVPLGAEVRAVLTQDGVEEARRYFGPDVTRVEGALIRWDQAGLGLTSELRVSRPGFPPTNMTETLEFLPHHLAGVEIKELDGRRTIGFTAGIVGAMAGVLWAAQHFGGSSDDLGEGEGPEPEASILFRIPFHIGGG